MFVMSRKSDNDRRSNDSAGQYGKVFSVAVVGLSGTEKDKGCLGVGKSCLCNRFVRPHADDYNRDHISVLSQTDFSGPIVNNEHWLYWGETRKCTEEGFELTFSVVEQTEFVDDACFQPFRSGKMEPYFRRCAATKLSSAEKLMYVCKNQLGVEKEYTQHYLADGRFNVDGFICVFDVSEGEDRDISRQVDLTALILSTLLKTKKPVVMVTTKNDEVCPAFMREAEKLVNRREFKGMIPLIETSAHDNINVDLAFWACVQRDWPKGKTKILSYQDSYQRQCDRRDMVSDNYLSLIRSHITDYRTHWKNTYSNLSQSQDFLVFCDLFGQEKAQQTFKRHVRMLRDDYVCRKMQKFLRILPEAFAQMLPNLESFGPDRTWPAVQQIIQNHSLFNEHFVVNEGLSWQDMDDSNESRIPFDLLLTPEAEKAFVNHLDGLLQEEHLRNLRHQFSELLRETPILPGQSLKNVRLHLSERECVQLLPESELGFIYEDYQRLLQERAREQFYELLLERAPFFMQYNTGKMVTQEDFAEISEKLMDDERWIAIDLLPQDRELALIRHLGFIQWPIKEHCLSYHACVDINSEVFCSSLAKPSRHHMWNSESEKIRVKLTIFGTMQLAENLASVIRAMQSWLEENSRISLDIHISSGNDNIGLLESRHYLNSLEPEAYFCIYSNRTTLEMVRKCLEQSLLTDLQFGNPHHANSASVCLPLTLLLAADSEVSSKERSYLREESQNRAQSLQCAFFDVTSDDRHTHFKSDELRRVLTYLTESVTRRSELMHVYNPASLNSIIPEGALNPEVRILLCMMCGDPILPAQFLELLLLPNTAFYPLTKNSIVTDVGYLAALDQATNGNELDLHDVPSRYVEFVISSYHGAFSQKDERLHGYILVYWSKRQASFSNMSAVVSNINTHPIVPINILALVENESRPSKLSHQLVAEGQELADSLNVNFRVSTLSHHLGRCISSFLNQLLENKHEIDESLQMAPTFIQSLAQHTSPNSTISSSNLNECYDPNLESHLGPMTVPPVSHSLHGQLPHDSVPDEALHDNIYEHLPNEHVSIPHEPNKAVPSVYERGGLPSPLVKQSRANNLRAQQQHMHSFGSGIIEPPDIASEHEPSSYFTTAYSRDSEEQLLKPSQIRQRSRRLNHYNLQSYPSADSLDLVYSVDSTYSNYYANLAQMPSHYVHRPFPESNFATDLSYGGGPVEPHPARPASSANIYPSHSNQPPPYSRVTVSPPPAYKMPPSYHLGYQNTGVAEPPLYPADHSFLPTQSQFFDQPDGSAYFSRKYYSTQYHLPNHNQSAMYRSYSPPFEPFDRDSNDYLMAQQRLFRPTESNVGVSSYRHSPLIYATTGRHHHARSSHFHQMTSNNSGNHFRYPSTFDSQVGSVSPFSVGLSLAHRQYKKKKKNSSKTRSSSSKANPSRDEGNVNDDSDDEQEVQTEEDEDESENSVNREDAFEKSRKISKLRHKRKTEEKAKIRRKMPTITYEGGGGEQKCVFESSEKAKGESEGKCQDGKRKKKQKLKKQVIPGGSGGGTVGDSGSEVVDFDGSIEPEDGDEEDDDTISSSYNSADGRLINAAADKYALSSGWAYHQTANAASSRHHLSDQWLPPQNITDEDSNSLERAKAPGKLDLKRFSNLSDAIGRLNLNSPSHPLGPTRASGHSFDESEYGARNFFEKATDQFDNLKHPKRGGRTKTKQNKEEGADSDNSDPSENIEKQSIITFNCSQPVTATTAAAVSKINTLTTAGPQASKRLHKSGKRRVAPVPVAPPRLPSSASHLTAVTPTSSGNGKLFLTSSSIDDQSPQNGQSTSEIADPTTANIDGSGSDEKAIDLEQSQLSENRRSRMQQMSKLYSLQAESPIPALALNFSENISNLDAELPIDVDPSDKKQVLKSKSVGTFSELDSNNKKLSRKADKLEKKRQKEEERKCRKASKETESRNRSRSKGIVVDQAGASPSTSALETFAQSNGNLVPLFIEKCTQFIEQEGLDMEGIYRVPGNRANVDTLLLQFDENPHINISELDIPVNAVATALKDFFMKRLPPIFPSDCMDDIANLSRQYSCSGGALAEIRTFLLQLPTANYRIIHFMIGHFVKVVQKSAINSMDSKNLAICWWPTLLQFEFSDMFVFEQMRPHLMDFVQILIDSYDELFIANCAKVNSSDELTNQSCSADELVSL